MRIITIRNAVCDRIGMVDNKKDMTTMNQSVKSKKTNNSSRSNKNDAQKHIDDMGISEPIYFVFSEKDRNALKERCCHMVGLDSAKPYRRNNRLFYKPYRNYFCAPSSGDELLDRLMRVAPNVMTKSELNDPSFKATDSIVYKLTPMGLRWLGHVLNIEIKTK